MNRCSQIVLALSTCFFAGCDEANNPTGPRNVPTAVISVECVASDGTSVSERTPTPVTTGPPPSTCRFVDASSFPDPAVTIFSRWSIEQTGEAFETKNLEYIFRREGEFTVVLTVIAEGESDTTRMTVFVVAGEAAEAVSSAIAQGELDKTSEEDVRRFLAQFLWQA